MELHSYLLPFREKCPQWLEDFKLGDNFNRYQFFNSRLAYYPGHGRDGHPVKLFGSTHSAHCFVYADYYLDQPDVEHSLSNTNPRFHRRFRGYHTFTRLNLNHNDLSPNGWKQHVKTDNQTSFGGRISPFAFLEILERDEVLDDQHGAQRLAILFLGADGIAAYDALFCQQDGTPPPFAALIQDHGFGGNYDKFGGDGLLERIALQCNVLPKFLLVASNTAPWGRYAKCLDVNGEAGGMNSNVRFLHEIMG